jgi:hypothetical protein
MNSRSEVRSDQRLICYSPIDDRHDFTRACTQIVGGSVVGAMAGLMICYDGGDDAYFLHGCDENWQTVTDTWHRTLDQAKQQAETEYRGISSTWIEC